MNSRNKRASDAQDIIEEALTRKTRRDAQRHQRDRDDLAESTLLGMDDGTTDSALNEELDFGKFDYLIEEEIEEQTKQRKSLERPAPVLEEQRRFREREVGRKIRWR